MTHLTGFPCSPVRRGARRGVAHHKQTATQRADKGNRPAVARGGPPGALRPLPEAGAPRRGRRRPGGPPRAIKWVIINAPWYNTKAQEGFMPPPGTLSFSNAGSSGASRLARISLRKSSTYSLPRCE